MRSFGLVSSATSAGEEMLQFFLTFRSRTADYAWVGYCGKGTSLIDLLAILQKNLNRATFWYILKTFRIRTIVIEALTPLEMKPRV